MTIEFLDEEVSEPSATTQPSTRRIVFAGEEDIQTQLNPEPEQPFFALEDAVSAIGTIPEALAVGVPAAFKRLVTGTAMPEESEVIERDLAFQERMQREQEDRQAAGKSSVVGEAIRGATPSLGSTIGSGGAAVAGGFLGLLGGPAAKVTVPAGIATASGLASYRMAASDLLYRSFRELEKSKGSPLTDEEKAKAYEVFLPLAQESGLWEAGPEAVSNVLLAGAGKFIFGFGKPVADKIVKDSIGRVTNQLGKKIAAGTGALAGELAGETTTAVGQFPAQAKAEQFIRTGTTEGAPTEYPGGVKQAFKDVAPSTIALTAGLGLVGGGAKLTTMPFQRQKSPEQIEEDNINLDAEREADNLLIPDNDAESKSIKAQIDSERADLVVKKELYNSLPEGDKAKAVLATEIKEYEGRITELDNTLRQRLGLSVTITPVEQRQIELAKQIAAPVEPAPTTPAPLPEAAPAPITPAEEAKPKAPPKYSPEGLAALTDAELASEEQSLALSVNREAVTDPQSELASLYQGALDLVRAEKSRREAATVTEAPAVTPAPAAERVVPITEPTEAVEDIEAGAPPLSTENLYFENNLAQRAWRIAAGFKYDKERGDWFHPSYPKLSRGNAEQEITDTNPPTKAQVRSVLDQLRQKYTPGSEKAAPVETPTFEKGDMVRVPNRVPVYEKGEIAGGKTVMVGGFVTRVMPDGKVEVRLQQGGYATLPPAQIEMRKKATTPAVSETTTPAPAVPAPTIKKMAAPVRVEEKVQPVPEADRYTFDEAGIRSIEFFGGKAPDGLLIVNDTTNPNYKMKAGYDSETGEIIVNRAYIKKGESIEDILTHELGHYIFSDPKFQADFKNFLESMPDDTRAEIEEIINQSYNKDTNQTQIEERQVMAFTALVKANKDTLSKWETIKNTIKRWINKIFGTNIKLSDEGAMAVFNVGFKRFKSGERIIRAMGEGTLRTAPEGMTQMDRDYLAAVERGDMETAQRMVDEAAKAAGYTVAAGHATPFNFNVFDRSKISEADPDTIIRGFFFSTEPSLSAAYVSGSADRGVRGKPRIINAYLDLGKTVGRYEATQTVKKQLKNDPEYQENGYSTNDDLYFPKNADSVEFVRGWKLTDDKRKKFEETGELLEGNRVLVKSEDGGVDMYREADEYGPREYITGYLDLDDVYSQHAEAQYILKESNQIKSADPVTYDDAGNVIPLSQRFQTSEPDIRRMAAEPRKMPRYEKKAQVASVPGIGAVIDTPKGINAKTETIIRDSVFNADIVNDNQTKKAWNLIQNLDSTNPDAGKNAQAINELTRETMQDVEAEEAVKQTIGAVKVRNELFKYAMKLTAEGDSKMLNYLLNNRLAFGSGTLIEGDPGRLLQAHQSLKNWIVRSSEAEQTGFFTIAAQQFFGTKTPTEDQIKQIKNIFNKVREVKINQEKELMTELEDVGKAAGVDLPNIVQKELDTAPGLDPMVVAIQNLLRMGGTFTYRPTKNKIGEAVKRTITQGITNYRKKMVSKAATGLETGFWKTLSTTEDKPGPLGELDAAQNRALGNIVKQSLVAMGLKGTPPDTKMTIYEQVASILGEKPLSKDKIEMADEKIRGGIEAKRQAELENASENQQDAINLKYDEMLIAWDDAMSRSLDMPVSDTMLRRLILNELKEADTSIQDIAKLMDEEPVIGASRQDRLVNSIIEKVTGITFEGQLTRDYTNLKTYLSDLLENMVLARQQKNKSAKAVAKVRKEASGDPNKQAEKQIEKLAKVQADPTIWGTGEAKVKLIDKVKQVVADALSLQLNIGFTPEQSAKIKNNWKGAFVADPNKKGIPTSFMLDMQRLGVDEATANTLADMVWNQIEFNAMNRQMGLINIAVEAGPLGGMVQAILDTPLAMQQDPEWRRKVITDYLKNAGIKADRADRIAELFDVSLRKRFAKAQEEAAIKAAKSIKGGLTTNSRRALEKFLKAIRAQVLDPGKDVAKAFGEQMGWRGFTSEQITKLNELDAIVNDNETTDTERFVATEQIQQIIDQVSAPPSVKEVFSSFYVGNALGRFTTFAVQAFDPLAFTAFNTAVRSVKNVTNPSEFIAAWADIGRAVSNFARETAFSFKNDVLRSGRMIDYLDNQDRKIKRLWDEAERKWKRGDISGAMKDGLFGYTAWTFRTLRALDDGAYSLLTTTTLPQYAEAALKKAGIPAKKRRGVMRQVLEAREIHIKQLMDKGMSRNDATVYANELMQGALTKELSGLGIDSQEVVDSAINDALSRIGKTRFMEDVLTGKIDEIKDLGFFSSWFLRWYENVSKSVNQQGGSEAQKIFYRVLMGFPLIPARIFNIAAGYTPLTIYRHALKNRYSLTYGTALQRRQRLVEQMAGTMALLPLLLLRSNSMDEEEEKKKGFGLYITGQGPSRTKGRELHAQWNGAHKPFSLELKIGGKTKFAVDAKSSGPLSVMIYTLGALDDWELNRKIDGMKTTDDDWRDAQEKASIFSAMYDLAGYFALTTSRRGPTTGVLQGLVDFRRYPDDPIAAIAAETSFSALPAVPVLGTGVAKNLSDFFSQPIDNRTKEGAILSNIPIIGPVAGQPALNAYGQRMGELRFSEKLKKSFGVPFTLVTSDSEDNVKLTSITLKQGDAPNQLRREDIENALQDAISDEEWRTAAEAYGKRNRERVLGQYETLFNMKPDKFAKKMTDFSAEAEKSAIKAVKDKRAQNP